MFPSQIWLQIHIRTMPILCCTLWPHNVKNEAKHLRNSEILLTTEVNPISIRHLAKPCQSSILVLSVWSYCSLASWGSVAAARLQNCADKTRPLHVLGEYVHWQYTSTLYNVIYSLHCAVYSVHSTVYTVHCTLYTLHCAYSRKYGHCQLYCNVLLQVSTHKSALCTVQCTLSCLAQFEVHTLFTLQFSLSSSVFVLCNVLYSVLKYNALIAVQCRTL